MQIERKKLYSMILDYIVNRRKQIEDGVVLEEVIEKLTDSIRFETMFDEEAKVKNPSDKEISDAADAVFASYDLTEEDKDVDVIIKEEDRDKLRQRGIW